VTPQEAIELLALLGMGSIFLVLAGYFFLSWILRD